MHVVGYPYPSVAVWDLELPHSTTETLQFIHHVTAETFTLPLNAVLAVTLPLRNSVRLVRPYDCNSLKDHWVQLFKPARRIFHNYFKTK